MVRVEVAQQFPEANYLAVPYTVLAIATVACAELILVATWRLAGMVERGRISHAAALKWVTLMVRSAGVPTALVAIVAIDFTPIEGLGPLSVPLVLLGGTAAVGACALILMVMRGLGGTAAVGACALILTVVRGLLGTAVQHKVEFDEVV